ncbi:regulator of microtubule dynamics protein 1-like [Branchiostoma floridae x Branchiostoma belcheri]|nr:Regulator of microtubule dynamics protein 1 [Branchiostoma belcheri]
MKTTMSAFGHSVFRLSSYITRSRSALKSLKFVTRPLVQACPPALRKLPVICPALILPVVHAWWGSSTPVTPTVEEGTPEEEPDPVQQAIVQADELYSIGDTVELYQFLLQHKDSSDAGILWRLARATRDYAHLPTCSPEDRKTLTYQALQFAEQALHIDSKDFACHKWYAICISDVGDYEGTKAKIANAYVIRDHFKEAIALNPKDATSIHLLGLWCFTMAEMPWYQAKIAAVIFATPPTSTYDEALGYFLQAESVDPGFYSMNLLMLGKTYVRLGNTSAAMLWLDKVRSCPSKSEEDSQAKLEAEELLKTLGATG